MKHHCDWGGCDATRAPLSKYCPEHTSTKAREQGRVRPDEGDLFAFAMRGVTAQGAVDAALALPPHQSRSATSTAAAVAIAPKFGTLRYTVWQFLVRHEGTAYSREQLARRLELRLSTICAVVADLIAQGYVTVAGTSSEASSAGTAVEIVRAVGDAERAAVLQGGAVPLPEHPKRPPLFFDVPAGTVPRPCTSCKARTYFIVTKNGAPMPVDCGVEGGAAPTESTPGRGVSHFATCPDASTHRRRKQ